MIVFNTIDWTDENKFSPEKWTWLELLTDFSIPIWGDTIHHTDQTLDLKKGDIFAVSFGEYQDTDKHFKECLWLFHNGKLTALKYLNPEFLELNELKSGGKVFADVTVNIKRLHKLNQILQ